MSEFNIKYDQEYKRTIRAVIFDSRATIAAVKDKGGFDLKAYADLQVGLVTDDVLPYKIVTNEGNLVCVFGVQTDKITGSGQNIFFFIRPAFQGFINSVQRQIELYVRNSEYRADMLL